MAVIRLCAGPLRSLVVSAPRCHPPASLPRNQDFEALTPNLLARTVETVEGGGIVVLLLSSLDSLTRLYSLTMDVHARLRTESHQTVTGGALAWVMCSGQALPARGRAFHRQQGCRRRQRGGLREGRHRNAVASQPRSGFKDASPPTLAC